MTREIEAADRAVVVDLEKRTKQAAAPAARAPSAKTPPKGKADVATGGSLCRCPILVLTPKRARNRRGHCLSSYRTRQKTIRQRRPRVILMGNVTAGSYQQRVRV